MGNFRIFFPISELKNWGKKKHHGHIPGNHKLKIYHNTIKLIFIIAWDMVVCESQTETNLHR